jgi:hypothetical protein
VVTEPPLVIAGHEHRRDTAKRNGRPATAMEAAHTCIMLSNTRASAQECTRADSAGLEDMAAASCRRERLSTTIGVRALPHKPRANSARNARESQPPFLSSGQLAPFDHDQNRR